MASSDHELLDVVDHANRVTGQLTRAEIHARGLLHRSVHVLVFNAAGEVFIQKRSLNKDTNPGLWDTSAAGHVDAGETPLAAAVRELAEELGIEVSEASLEPVALLEPDASNGYEFVKVYRVESDAPMTLEGEEIDDGRWQSLSELQRSVSGEPASYTDVFRHILSLVS